MSGGLCETHRKLSIPGQRIFKINAYSFWICQKQNLLKQDENKILVMYHDNPEFGKEEQFRTSLCVTVPEDCTAKEDGKLGVTTIEAGLYAVGHFEIRSEEFESAWDYMYQTWLMTSGYVPRNASPFEVYLNNPKKEKEHLIKVDIYVPVEPIILLFGGSAGRILCGQFCTGKSYF